MANVSDGEVPVPVRTGGGDTLTQQDLDALAAEAETGYDLGTATRMASPPAAPPSAS